MESTCCQPDTPIFQYYPPPTPAWLNPSSASSSSSSQMPTWVKVAIGIAVLLLCCILYIFLKRRGKETTLSWTSDDAKPAPTTSSSARPPEKVAKKTPQPQALTVESPGPCCGAGLMLPSTCPSCPYDGGLYHGKFRCPSCSYRKEVGVHVQYPD